MAFFFRCRRWANRSRATPIAECKTEGYRHQRGRLGRCAHFSLMFSPGCRYPRFKGVVSERWGRQGLKGSRGVVSKAKLVAYSCWLSLLHGGRLLGCFVDGVAFPERKARRVRRAPPGRAPGRRTGGRHPGGGSARSDKDAERLASFSLLPAGRFLGHAVAALQADAQRDTPHLTPCLEPGGFHRRGEGATRGVAPKRRGSAVWGTTGALRVAVGIRVRALDGVLVQARLEGRSARRRRGPRPRAWRTAGIASRGPLGVPLPFADLLSGQKPGTVSVAGTEAVPGSRRGAGSRDGPGGRGRLGA